MTLIKHITVFGSVINQLATGVTAMVVNTGNKMYKITCSKCNWQDQIIVNSGVIGSSKSRRIPLVSSLINKLAFEPKLPKKCPKCGGTLTHKEESGIRF